MLLSSLVAVLVVSLNGVQPFLPKPVINLRRKLQPRSSSLWSSEDDETDLEAMRRLLEASWDADTMGEVPTNPQMAAREAASSLKSAIDDGQSSFLVNLLLPQYDITQGTNIYDELLAVEFCIEVATLLEDRACILVRDSKTLNAVNRILDARERDRPDVAEEHAHDDEDDDEEDDDEEDDDDLKDDSKGDGEEHDADFYDNFADFRSIGGSASDVSPQTPTNPGEGPSDDVGAFRKQLLDSWESPETTTEAKGTVSANKAQDEKPKDSSAQKTEKRITKPSNTSRLYRLASLFGNSTISSGPEMMEQVGKAVAANGKPTDDEGTVIVLSAVTQEEMVAIRSLISTYKTKKKFVMVNCQLDPLPRELIRANTVYSILPLIAKPAVLEQNLFGKDKTEQENDETPPKVVLMRRYPKDWEVFVDANGGGFELAEAASPEKVPKKGPSMQWIAGVLKRHLQSKLG